MKRLLAVFMTMCLTMGTICLDVNAADPSETVTDNSVTVSETNAGDEDDLTNEVDPQEEIEVSISELVEESAAAAVAAEDEATDTSASTVSDDILYSGTDGDLEWSISSDGVLTISGTGDYHSGNDTYTRGAWTSYASEITSAVVNVSGITYAANMFYGCSNMTSVDLRGMDTSDVTNMTCMFYGCTSLTSLNLSTCDTSDVTDMSLMFYGCSNLSNLNLANFDTSSVTNMYRMFQSCSALKELDVTSFNTENVTDMSGMFYGCSGLVELDLSGFDTSSVTDMSFMFCHCKDLISLDDVSGFNTSRVTDMSKMFNRCSSLVELDLSGFDTSHVTDMSYMFAYCEDLIRLDVSKFDTAYVTDMSTMFGGCSSLTSLDLNSFNTAEVTDMSGMFGGCSSLTSLDLKSFNTENVLNMGSMFIQCSSLTDLDLSGFDTSKVTNMGGMILYCSGLKEVKVSKNWNLATSLPTIENSYWIDEDGAVCTAIAAGLSVPMTYTLVSESSSVTIITQPQSVTVEKSGDTATLTVEAEGDGLTYCWYYKNPGNSVFKEAGYYTESVSVVMLPSRDGREMYCVITDEYGNTVTTDIVTLSIKAAAITIITQPQSVVVENEGDMATVTVVAEGESLSYSWYYKNPGNRTFSESKIYTASTTVAVTAARNGRQMYCVITDADGNSVTTETVTLSIQEKQESTIMIVTQPESVVVENEGDTATVTVVAEGDGLSYSWYYKNPGNSTFSESKIYTASTTVAVTAARNGRQMYCVITDVNGNSVTTDTVTLSIKEEQENTITIVAQPQSVTVANAGDVATVSVEAEGDGLTYSWYYKNPGNSDFKESKIYTSSTTVAVTEARNGRQMYCVITDVNGNSVTTDIVTLSIQEESESTITIITQPESVVVENEGDTATLTVVAEGDGLSYSWYYKNPGNRTFSESKIYTASTTVAVTAARNGRQMYCVITDVNGNSVTTDTVTLSIQAEQETSVVSVSETDEVTVDSIAEEPVSIMESGKAESTSAAEVTDDTVDEAEMDNGSVEGEITVDEAEEEDVPMADTEGNLDESSLSTEALD